MNKYHNISGLKFEADSLVLNIDGQKKKYKLKEISPVLENASMEARNNFEIASSGYGIYWPLLDEDISIDGLLGIIHEPQWKKKIA